MVRLQDIAQWLRRVPIELRYTLLLFAITRAALLIIGIVSRILLDPFHIRYAGWNYSPSMWLGMWGVWDSGWYLDIAQHGYSSIINAHGEANYGFFPLYPLLMKYLGYIVGNTYIAGLVISNICLIISGVYLYKLVRTSYDTETSHRSITYLFLFPTAFILSAALSESVFLLLLILSFYYAARGSYMPSGIFGFFLTLTRPVGIAALIPLAYLYLKQKKFALRKIRPDALWLILFPAALVIFCVFCYHLTGDFFAYAHAQQTGWGRVFGNPLAVLLTNMLSKNINHSFSAYYALFSIIIILIGLKRIGLSYTLIALLLILIPLSTHVLSMPRYSAVIFPYFILFSLWGKNRYIDQSIIAFCSILLGFLMVMWVNGFLLMV